MKVSLNWLQEYLNITDEPQEIAEKVSLTGIEVTEINYPAKGLKKIVVGHINSMEPHPDSDHMKICQVDVGGEKDIQIVCGAPNVAVGQNVIVALSGARISNNEKIKKGKLRGVESDGMICALQEIGFDEAVVPDEYKDGIYVFSENVQVGSDVYQYLGMNDYIFEFDITPNRADVLSVHGYTWEVGATYDQKPEFPGFDLEQSKDDIDNLISVDNNVDTQVKQLKYRVVKDVKVQSSPMWMQTKLWNAGIKPINNVIDSANYVLLEYGQPINVYDMDKINPRNLSIRYGNDKEKFLASDDKEYELSNEDLVVDDDGKAIGIAGIIGDKGTQVTAGTHDVLIEAGIFHPTTIRKSAQRLNIRTQSSIRLEKGVDDSAIDGALDRTAYFLSKFAEGDVIGSQYTVQSEEVNDIEIDVTVTEINDVLGTNIDFNEMKAIFNRVGFEVETNNNEDMTVVVPPRRWDISIKADLVEEVIRIYGYENLPMTLPSGNETVGGRGDRENYVVKANNLMLSHGLDNVLTYSMVESNGKDDFVMEKPANIKVAWPMTQDHEYVRNNIVNGLVRTAKYNMSRKQSNIAIYETGRVFLTSEHNQAREAQYIAGLMTGKQMENDWFHDERKVDFFDLKHIVEDLIETLCPRADYKFTATDEYSNLHPGQAAKITINGEFVGFIGKIHPSYQKDNGLNDTFVFQINLDVMFDQQKENIENEQISKYPAIERDIAILIKENITNQEIEDTIFTSGGKNLKSVKLFDIYTGEGIEDGYKSMAYRLVFQNNQDTLTDDQVTQVYDKIVAKLVEKYQVEIR